MPEGILDNIYQISWAIEALEKLIQINRQYRPGINKGKYWKKKENEFIEERQTLVKKISHPEWLIQLSLSVYANAWAP